MTAKATPAPAPKPTLSIWDILTHLGDVVKTVVDIEHVIVDIIKKQAAGADVTALLTQLAQDLTDGIIPLPPGVTAQEIIQAIQSLLPSS